MSGLTYPSDCKHEWIYWSDISHRRTVRIFAGGVAVVSSRSTPEYDTDHNGHFLCQLCLDEVQESDVDVEWD